MKKVIRWIEFVTLLVIIIVCCLTSAAAGNVTDSSTAIDEFTEEITIVQRPFINASLPEESLSKDTVDLLEDLLIYCDIPWVSSKYYLDYDHYKECSIGLQELETRTDAADVLTELYLNTEPLEDPFCHRLLEFLFAQDVYVNQLTDAQLYMLDEKARENVEVTSEFFGETQPSTAAEAFSREIAERSTSSGID